MVALGVLLHAIGGFAAGSFYIPFKKVRNWAWESYWLVGGVFSWIIMPWLVAALTVPDLLTLLRKAPTGSLLHSYIFGVLWGVGGLTFGLSMRVSGDVPGLRDRPGVLRRLWHARAADLQRHLRRTALSSLRPDDPGRRGGLRDWYRDLRTGRHR